jgi:phage FluMu gp28-like protein
MCVFSDRLVVFLPFAVIQRAQSRNLQMARSIEVLQGVGRDLYVGVDIGRRRDLTVIWVASRTGDAFVTEAVYVLADTPFVEQERVLGAILGTHCVASCCIDEQGNGMQLAENMGRAFPGIVHGVTFTNPLKAEIAGRLRVAMETDSFFMPTDPDLTADFASIQRNITPAGNVQIAAPVSGSGHGDCFWAAGLTLHAAVCYPRFELVMAG